MSGSSFFGKKKVNASTGPTIRQEVRKVAKPAATRDQAAAASPSTSRQQARPAARAPPPDRYKLTPSRRTTPHTSSASYTTTTNTASLKSRPAAIRRGQKRKSASPAAPVFGSDDDSSNSDASSVSPAGANKKTKLTVIKNDDARHVRDRNGWPSAGQTTLPTDSNDDAGLIHGRDLCVDNHANEYRLLFTSSLPDASSPATVALRYPGGSPPEIFALAEPKKAGDYHPVDDLAYTIDEVLQHYLPESLSSPLLHPSDDGSNTTIEFRMRRALRQGSLDDFKDVVQSYNAFIERHLRDGQIATHLDNPVHFPSPLNLELVKRILSQIYARTVSPRIEILSKYADKSNTYGELLPPFASQVFKDAGLKSHHTFLDLGSGVGNVVLQAALEIGCKSYGIEMMQNPCILADAQAAEFPRRTKLWGLSAGPIKLWKGDFLDDPLISKLLPTVDVVLVNNEVFGADLNDALKIRLLDLKEGARLISLKSFVPDGWQLTQRTSGDPIAGYEIVRKQFWTNWVSWKYEGGDYFVAVKNSERIARVLQSGRSREAGRPKAKAA